MLYRFATLLGCALFATLSKSQDTAQPVSTIIDDTDPTVIYDPNPSGLWVTTSSLGWDTTKLYFGTFHRGDDNAHAQYTFAGIGIKVVIAARDMPGAWTNISFFIDNTKRGEYILEGTNANQLLYNITAFEVSDLFDSSHVLDIVGGQGDNIAMYIDYIQYTQLLPVTASSASLSSPPTQLDSSTSRTTTISSSTSRTTQSASIIPFTPTSSSTSPRISTIGIIGVGVMVAVIVLLFANLAIWISRRRSKVAKRPKSSDTALLKFHQDASIPRDGMHEASYSYPSRSTLQGAYFQASCDPHGRYTLLQTPSPSLARGGS